MQEFNNGKPILRVPFGYRFAYRNLLGGYYYLFPFNLLVRLIHVIKKKKAIKRN